jgi:hypothetical protein
MCVCVVPCLCVCVTVSVNGPAGSIFFLFLILGVIVCSLSFFSWFLLLFLITQFLLLALPHFVELEDQGKDKETPDIGDQDTGFHCRGDKFSNKTRNICDYIQEQILSQECTAGIL